MSSRLKGRTALVTGGTTGIGLATARRFHEEGARVAVTGRNPETLAQARETLGSQVLVIPSDAGNPAAQPELAAKVAAALGPLDVVFLNAGTGTFQPVEAIEPAEFDRQFAINVKGPMFLLKALSAHLSPRASVIVNASVAARVGLPHTAIYAATKGAVVAFAQAIAAEWAPRGIRVNAISPGPIATPIYDKLGMPAEAAAAFGEQVRQSVPLKRFGDPREVADVAVFLASDDSSYVTGANIAVDGGRAVA